MKKALIMLTLTVALCLAAVVCVSAADFGDGYVAWDFSDPTHVAEWSKTSVTEFVTTGEGTKFGERISYSASKIPDTNPQEYKDGGIKVGNNMNMSYSFTNPITLDNYSFLVYKYSNATTSVSAQFYHYKTDTPSGTHPYFATSLSADTALSGNVKVKKISSSEIANQSTASWTGDLKKLRFDPMRTSTVNNGINVIMLGIFKDEDTYNQYCVDSVAERFSDYTEIFAEDAASALAQAKDIADKLETNVYGDGMVITVSEENAALANGEFTFAITAEQGGKTAQDNVTLKVIEQAPHVIFNFDNPVMLKAMHATGATKELVTNSAADAGEYGLLGENVALLTKFTDDNNPSTEFNFYVNPGDGVIPAISDLSDYPVVFYSYKAAKQGVNQLYYYTDGHNGGQTGKGHVYLLFNSAMAADNGFAVGSWANKTLLTNDVKTTDNTVTGDITWNNTPSKLRFDFMRQSYTHVTDQPTASLYIQDGTTLYLDYIGFFKSAAHAKAFAANPTLDTDITTVELEEKYADVLEAANSLNVGIDLSMYDTDTDGALSEAEIKAFIKSQMTDKGVTDDYYVIISENIAPLAATPDKPNGTNGRFKFTVYVSDAINNGNYAASEEITVHVYADPLFDIRMLGVQYRADGTPGLRFGTQVSFSEVFTDKFTAAGVTDVTYGTLIMPLDAYNKENISLTHAGIGDDGMIGGYEVSDKVKVTADTGKILTDGAGSFVYTAVVVGIPAGHENVMLSARSYVKYTYGGQTYYCYASPIERCVSNAQNQEENWK